MHVGPFLLLGKAMNFDYFDLLLVLTSFLLVM